MKVPNASEGLVIYGIGGNCPVEAEGLFDEYKFYFRARGQYWTLWLIHNDSLTNESISHVVARGKYSDNPFDAGWMTIEEATTFISLVYVWWKGKK